MARSILGSIWDRGNRNELNRMLEELYGGVDKVTTDKGISTKLLADGAVNYRVLADGAVRPQHMVQNAVTNRELAGNSVDTVNLLDGSVTHSKIDESAVAEFNLHPTLNRRDENGSYNIGVDFGACFFNGNVLDINIKALRIFLKSGTTFHSLTGGVFTLERNDTLYVDLSETTPTIKVEKTPPQSGTVFGNGGFYDDRKILLLSNFYGVYTGRIADSLKNAIEKTKTERLMAHKTDADTFQIYLQSKENSRKYVKYEVKRAVVLYSSTNPRSNADVHEINSAHFVTRNPDNTFTENGQIASGGAWSIAIREAGVTDSIGSIAHGDEIETFFDVKLDGISRAMSNTLTAYKSIEFVGASELYRDSGMYTDLTKVGRHFKTFLFNENELIMDSKVILDADLELIFVYLGMVGVLKDFVNKAVTDIDLDIQDLTTDTADVHTKRQGISRIDVYGSNVSINTEVLERETPSIPSAKVEHVSYNKIYYDLVEDYYAAKSGDVFRQKTRIGIDIR